VFVEGEVPTPFVGLAVSGGHTALYLCSRRGEYRLLGQTLDDAAGEAFDKVAKLLGLGYPGGVEIDRLAREGNPTRFRFPRPMISSGNADFSFSGLKTALRDHCARYAGPIEGAELRDICASFQEAAVETLVEKAGRAARDAGVGCLVACGGVACNSRLRERLGQKAKELGLELRIPRPRLCTDNAVMVAAAGRHRFLLGVRGGLDLNAIPTWPLEGLG
jgi:N6-L-threonylcarbamoyladenine synthase